MAKLWLDDVRKPPDESWTWCKSAESALTFTIENECEEWALDHDLGGQLAHYGRGPYDHTAPTGAYFAYIVMRDRRHLPPRISIHSTNQDGAMWMLQTLYAAALNREEDIEIALCPMRGRIMDKTPYYEEALRA